MAKSASIFPHFIRIFSASILWSGLTALLVLNVYAKAVLVPEVFPSMISAMLSPFSPNTHLALAQKLWSLGFLTAAERELTLAETSDPNVLGISSVQDLKNQWEHEPEAIIKNYQFWQSVIRDKPDYRAGLVYTAALSYQLSRFDEGKTYVAEASVLDPNNALLKSLVPLFTER